jgi:hypothetical protein
METGFASGFLTARLRAGFAAPGARAELAHDARFASGEASRDNFQHAISKDLTTFPSNNLIFCA